jgi:hypothetical protein
MVRNPTQRYFGHREFVFLDHGTDLIQGFEVWLIPVP